MNNKKLYVSVIIPAINEEKIISKIIADIYNLKQYKLDPIVVIDSKTKDNTKSEAEKAGARVLHIGKGRGKGYAVRRSIPHLKGDFAIQIDSDYQFQPKDIPKLIDPLENQYDVTLGTRYQKGAKIEKGSVSFLNYAGSYFLSWVTSLVIGQRITDVMAGFKAFRTKDLKMIAPKTHHFGYEAELIIKSAQRKMRILNVPITYKKRVEGISSVNPIKHGFLVLGTIIKTALKV